MTRLDGGPAPPEIFYATGSGPASHTSHFFSPLPRMSAPFPCIERFRILGRSRSNLNKKSKLLCSTILRLLMSCFIQRRLSQQLTDRSSSPRGRTGPQTTTYWGCLGEVDTDLTYHRDMAHPVIHISEAEAASDFASVLARVRAGAEVVIESESGKLPVAVIHSPVPPRRSISECIALARKHEEETGESPVLDPDFAADVEEIIHNRKP